MENDDPSLEITKKGISPAELDDAIRYWLDQNKETPSVVAISGPWGSGKTYWWKHFIESELTRSVYVSLFGISDVKELEQRVLAASFGVDVPLDEERIGKGFQSIGKLVKIGADVFKDVPGSGVLNAIEGYVGSVVRDAAYSRLNRAVVAIDDLERRSSTLALEQVLGFVSRLREVWNASVVLILNEVRLKTEDKTRLDEFREKVIDCDFQFAIAPSTAAEIGLKSNPWALRGATNFAEQVGLCNVRIFQRVDSILSRLVVNPATIPEPVLDRLANSVTGIAWAHFSRASHVPTAEQLLQFNSFAAGVKAADKNRNREPYEETLSKIRWIPDSMDNLVYEIVASGRVPSEEVNKQIQAYLLDHKRNDSSSRMQAAWDMYWSTLRDNANDFSEALSSAYVEHIPFSSLNELSGAVDILEKLEKHELARELVDKQIDWWKANDVSRERLGTWHIGFSAGSYLETKLAQLSPDTKSPLTPAEVLTLLSNKSGWGASEETVLLRTSKSEWIDTLENFDLAGIGTAISSVRSCYAHIKANKRPYVPWETSPLDEALVELGARSKIAQLRVDVLLRD